MVVFIQIFNQRWDILSFSEQHDCSGSEIKRLICEAKVRFLSIKTYFIDWFRSAICEHIGLFQSESHESIFSSF